MAYHAGEWKLLLWKLGGDRGTGVTHSPAHSYVASLLPFSRLFRLSLHLVFSLSPESQRHKTGQENWAQSGHSRLTWLPCALPEYCSDFL